MSKQNVKSSVTSIGIVGGGLMGTGIAEVSALAGFDTVLVKATPGPCEPIRGRVEASMARRVERGTLEPDHVEASLARLVCTADRDALAECDLIIESIVEDAAAKKALFADLAGRIKPGTILASNTSTLHIADLVPTGYESRTVGMHFFSPVPAMNLVELAELQTTDPAVTAQVTDVIERMGKTAVPVLDTAGFVVNRLLVPYLLGAIAAYSQGIAPAAQIDTAMKLGCGHPMGPLRLSDLIGLDVVFAMSKLLYREFHDSRFKPPALLRRMVQDGNLGKKTGMGFYDYSTKPPLSNPAIWDLIRTCDPTSATY